MARTKKAASPGPAVQPAPSGPGTYHQVNGKKAPRMDDTERTRIETEIRGYISDLPPSVDKLKEAADKAVEESRALRLEARRTAMSSQTGMKAVHKDPDK